MLSVGNSSAMAYAPENILASFKKSLGNRCGFYRTKDNEIVVIHDEIINRPTNGSLHCIKLQQQNHKLYITQ